MSEMWKKDLQFDVKQKQQETKTRVDLEAEAKQMHWQSTRSPKLEHIEKDDEKERFVLREEPNTEEQKRERHKTKDNNRRK